MFAAWSPKGKGLWISSVCSFSTYIFELSGLFQSNLLAAEVLEIEVFGFMEIKIYQMQKIPILVHAKGKAPRIQLLVTDSTGEPSPSANTWLNTALGHYALCPGKLVGKR